ncbi:MAG TPA: hypothetical protein VF179_29425 [Thermoanaerobaculia bacterium]|nr:hypothetical protein [Thermoanaerobaculia bacterium]
MVDDEKRPEDDPEQEQEIALTWAKEAERRNQEMDETGDEGIPAEEVFGRLRSRTRRVAEHEESQDPH